MSFDDRVDAWVALAQRALPPRALAELLRAFGDPRSVLGASRAALSAIVTPTIVRRVLAPPSQERLDASRRWLSDPVHEIVAWDDADFPRALLDLVDPPPVLFAVGRRELLNRPSLAIVGSRNATPQGVENARAFADALSGAGMTIVSGLALGVDAAAHRGALGGAGSTIAVMGTGPDRVYPARNRDLAHAIASRGLLLTEFAPGTLPLKENFPRRNRLIAGLARGVLVVEATLSSGSLITARLAGEQGREVFAIPGSIHSPFSKGPHRLIRDGAKLVETAQDVLEELGAATAAPSASPDAAAYAGVSQEHAALLDAMAHDPIDLDTLIARTAMRADVVSAALTALELDGRVSLLPGGRWQRTVA